MMRKVILLLLAMAGLQSVMAQDVRGVEIKKRNGESLHIANADIKSLTFAGENAVITSASGEVLEIPRSAIQAITSLESVATEYSVSYDEGAAAVVNPYALQGVATEIDGAYVTVTNANESEELSFALSGTTTDGAFVYNGTYKCTLKLNGVSIASNRDAAIDMKCGKRIAVVLAEGTENTLSDYAGGEQKAALRFKGHPEFEGGGTLNVTGNAKHAISSKEYLQLKKSTGTINILGAKGDGIHAGQYFQMNGGELNINNVGDDGVQAELTDDETDEMNGEMLIKGGTINILCTADGAVETNSNTQPPAYGPGGGGGWRPGGGGGGTQPGSSVETSSSSCMKADKNANILGGMLNLRATGKGGKGLKVDGALTIGEDGADGPSITIDTEGSVVSKSGTGFNASLSGQPKAVRVEGDITVNSGYIHCTTKQEGGEGIESKAAITINGGAAVANTYDDGINAKTKITVNGGMVWSWATNNDGMDCNGSNGFELNGGIILASGATSPEEGFDCDNYKFAINGGTVIGTGGATSTVTSAKQPYKQQSSQSITQGTYLCLQKNDGTVICGYCVPHTLNATVVVSTPEFEKGTSYKLVRNATITNPQESYLDGRFVVGGSLAGGTSTSITPSSK